MGWRRRLGRRAVSSPQMLAMLVMAVLRTRPGFAFTALGGQDVGRGVGRAARLRSSSRG